METFTARIAVLQDKMIHANNLACPQMYAWNTVNSLDFIPKKLNQKELTLLNHAAITAMQYKYMR